MLGPAKPRRLHEPITISLEDLVPSNHFYRHLETTLDLSFVRDWARELYAERGRPSIDPVVFFKLQLVMFFEGIRSERKLIEIASLNLAHRWYLGYALDDHQPRYRSRLLCPQSMPPSARAQFRWTSSCSCYRYASDYRERGAWGMFRHEMRHGLLIEGGIHHLDQLRNLCDADCQTISGWDWNPGLVRGETGAWQSSDAFDGEAS